MRVSEGETGTETGCCWSCSSEEEDGSASASCWDVGCSGTRVSSPTDLSFLSLGRLFWLGVGNQEQETPWLRERKFKHERLGIGNGREREGLVLVLVRVENERRAENAETECTAIFVLALNLSFQFHQPETELPYLSPTFIYLSRVLHC